MSKVITFSDGTIYVERPGSRWGRVNVSSDPFLLPDSAMNEVCYIAVNDITPPPSQNKGSTMPMSRAWFDYLDKAHNHTSAASQWMRTPYMLWSNRPYNGDPLGTTNGDPEPVLECITGSGNILRVIGETATHYEIWAMPITDKPAQYNPAVYNFKHFPWVFWKAQARTRQGVLQRVGNALDVYHINFRKPGNRHWISKQVFTLFAKLPLELTYNNVQHLVIDYMFVGAEVYGITSDNQRIPLMVKVSGLWFHPTAWRSVGTPVV
jgi:hypothetical protein